jgi:hypothetical protein
MFDSDDTLIMTISDTLETRCAAALVACFARLHAGETAGRRRLFDAANDLFVFVAMSDKE